MITKVARAYRRYSEENCIQEASYFVMNRSTLRETAEKFQVAPSTIEIDICHRLRDLDYTLWKQVMRQINLNRDQRCYRGGEATRRKFAQYNKEEDV